LRNSNKALQQTTTQGIDKVPDGVLGYAHDLNANQGGVWHAIKTSIGADPKPR